MRFRVFAKMENELIPRTCFVTTGNAQVIYAPGRSLEITADNPQAFDLQAHYSLDEYAGGLSEWEDRQLITGMVAETDLELPNFCARFEVFSPGAAAAPPSVKGYGPGGVLVYEEVLAVPRSGEIPIIPQLDYTISPTGVPAQSHVVLYECVG